MLYTQEKHQQRSHASVDAMCQGGRRALSRLPWTLAEALLELSSVAVMRVTEHVVGTQPAWQRLPCSGKGFAAELLQLPPGEVSRLQVMALARNRDSPQETARSSTPTGGPDLRPGLGRIWAGVGKNFGERAGKTINCQSVSLANPAAARRFTAPGRTRTSTVIN